MMKVSTILFMAFLIAISQVDGASCQPTAGPAGAENLSINFSTWHPHDSREVREVWTPMLDLLAQRSNMSLGYTIYDGGALGPGPEHYDLVASGRSEMGYATLSWTPERFPLSEVLSLPAEIKGKDVATEIGNAVYDRILYTEFQDVKVLEVNPCIHSYLWTVDPVRSLEDVQGLRIRSPGGMQTRCLEALGAEPIFMPLDAVYESMENGSIDGVVTCPPMVLDYRLYEVADCATRVTFGCVAEGLFMNLDAWNRTSEGLRPLIEEVCANPYRTTGSFSEEDYGDMIKSLDEKVDIYSLPEEEAGRWYALFQEATREWVDEMEAEGHPAREAVMIFNQECMKWGVLCPSFPPEWR